MNNCNDAELEAEREGHVLLPISLLQEIREALRTSSDYTKHQWHVSKIDAVLETKGGAE